MPRKPTGKPPGRPKKEFDWEVVDQMLEAGCNGIEISSFYNMHYNNFYEKVLVEKGVGFTEYSSSKKNSGKGCLRYKQYSEAMSGNTALLLKLGEIFLDQGKNDFDSSDQARADFQRYQAFQRLEATLHSRGFKLEDLENEQSLLYQRLTGQKDQVPDELGTESSVERPSSLQDNSQS